MSEDRWAKSKRIFGLASGLVDPERAELLARECGDDDELRAEVEALLRHHDLQDPASLEVPRAVRSAAEPDVAATIDVGGEFRIRSELGRGGTGVVYLAHQVRLRRDVALKVLAEGLTTPRSHVRRFHDESRRAAGLNHPGIAQVYVDGRHGPLHWFAMELVPGHDLAKELRLQCTRPVPGEAGPILPRFGDVRYVAAVARLCQRVASALVAAHAAGIVHRDVKPANILLQPDGSPKLVDFGIARDEKPSDLTRTGEIVGTVHYMSPEQAKLAAIEVDHRTDVYSLGIVMFELLTLQRPYGGETAFEVRANIQKGEPPSLRALNPRLPRDLVTICCTAMAKDLEDRYESAAALAADLERFLGLEAILAVPTSWPRRARRWLHRRRVLVGALFALVAAISIGSIVGGVVAASRQRDAALAGIVAVDARETLDGVDPTELAAARRACAAFDGDSPVATRLAGRIERYGKALYDDGVATIQAARQAIPASDELALQGRLRVERAAIVLGRTDLLANLPADSLAPLVSVEWGPGVTPQAPAAVSFVPLDPLTGVHGKATSLGAMPLRLVVVPPGPGRIRVDVPGSAPREFTRMFERGNAAEPIVVDPIDRSAGMTGMILIPRGTLRLQDQAPPVPSVSALDGRVLEIDAFWIDECEVRNADFRPFLEAHPDHPRPPYWDRLEPSHDDLPVTFVSWETARMYAEWVGKRLPTYAEWSWAARLPDQRLYPWGNASDDQRGNTHQPSTVPGGTLEARIAAYFERAAPVRSHDGTVPGVPDARTPSKMYHALGNVAEWTETAAPRRDASGVMRAAFESRIVVGDYWSAAVMDTKGNLSTTAMHGLGPTHVAYWKGFRCARSR